MAKTRPLKFTDPQEFAAKVEDYFGACEASREERELRNGDKRVRYQRPSMIGLAVWLGCSRDTLYEYLNEAPKSCIETDNERDIYREISGTIACARDRIEAATLQDALDGDADPRASALLLGTYGYSERIQHDATARVVVEGNQGDLDRWSR